MPRGYLYYAATALSLGTLLAFLLFGFNNTVAALPNDGNGLEYRPAAADHDPQPRSSFTADSYEPGVNTGYRITFEARFDYDYNSDELEIELEDFRVPRSIRPSTITIQVEDGAPANPRSVSVEDGEELELTLPDFDPSTAGIDADADKINAGERVAVIIQRAAGIINPTEGGRYWAEISGGEDDDQVDREDDEIETNSLTIHRIVTLSQDTVNLGDAVTATGKGFKNGTSLLFFLDENGNGALDSGEVSLCNVTVGNDDTGACSFTVDDPPFSPGNNYVNAVDGRSNHATMQNDLRQRLVLPPSTGPTPAPATTPSPSPTPSATATPTPAATPAPQLPGGRLPPHVFIGTARLDGSPVAEGTLINAYAGTKLVGATRATPGGNFSIHTHQSTSNVTFTVADSAAREKWTQWEAGMITPGFDLNASSVTPVEETPASVFRANPVLVSAFFYDNASKEWQFYDPRVDDASTLKRFIPGEPYLFRVSRSVWLLLNGTEYHLTCVRGNCWNQIVW